MLRNIVTVGQSELATAVIKATYPDSDLPKAKHVIAIVQTISKAPHLAREVSELIKQRIERCLKSGSQYRMLFKCLLVLHKLAMQRDSQNLIKVLVAMPLNFLHLSSYLDRTSTTSWGHSLFCRQYAAYIAQKVSSCRELGTSYEHTNSDTKNHMSALKPKKLGKISDILITQLEALLECKAYQEAFDTEGGGLLSKMAISLLTRDLFGLTTILNLALYSMMDFLTDLDKKTTKSFIKSVDGFLACVPAIAKFRSIAIHEAVSEAKKLLPGSDQLKTSKDWLKKVKTCLETHLLDAPKKSKKKKKKV